MKQPRMKTAVVLLMVAAVLVTGFLVVRWVAYGTGNMTDNDFKPPSITPSASLNPSPSP